MDDSGFSPNVTAEGLVGVTTILRSEHRPSHGDVASKLLNWLVTAEPL
jgi:hypothetical protein